MPTDKPSTLSLASNADAGPQFVDGVRMLTDVRLVEVASLLPYARNTKTHGKKQIAALAARIQEVGWTNPVLYADGVLIAGHGRIMAAKQLGLARVPGIDCSHLSERERRELVIWDNRSAELDSGWDLEMLKLETDDLRAEGVDLEAALGFSEEDLAAMFEGLEEPQPDADGDPDDTPELQDAEVSRVGDVWVLGPHRLAVGDSTDSNVWDALMLGERADACFTDPPYLVDVGRKNRLMDGAVGGQRSKTGSIENDAGMTEEEFAQFLAGAYACLHDTLKPGGVIYVSHSDKAGGIFRAEFERAGFHFSQGLIWAKPQFVLGVADFQPSHEPILYGWKSGSRHRWYGGRKQRTVMEAGDSSPFRQLDDGRWAIRIGDQTLIVDGEAKLDEAPASIITEAKPAKSGLHPTQKPVALVERLLRNSARPGDIVVDAFGGSGTTLVAADRLNMSARLVELDPRFADVIVRRWQALTGRRAVHLVTGELFPSEGEVRVSHPDDNPAKPGPEGVQGEAKSAPTSSDIF